MRKDPNINLHLGCSLQAMREMRDNQYDLAIVDPPYGIGVNVSMGRRKGHKISTYKKFYGEDKEAPPPEYFQQLFRVSKEQIIWGANHFFTRINRDSKGWIVWDKLFSNDVSFAACELAWSSLNITVKKYTGSSANKNRIHPTEKPIPLYKWCLEKFAKEGDKILDTHLGSGSIACACYDLGFDLDAWEKDPEYFDRTIERYTEHSRQTKLF